MKRRDLLAVAGLAVIAPLSGCLGALGVGDGDEGPLDVVEAYLDALSAGDLDEMAAYMHTHHPFHPDNFDEEPDLEEVSELRDYHIEFVEEEYGAEDLKAHEATIGNWLEHADASLEEVIEGEQAALVKFSYERVRDERQAKREELLLTEDGEWRLFHPYPTYVVPDDEPTTDETYLIVEDIEFDGEEGEATIHLTEPGDIVAEALVTYSTNLPGKGVRGSAGSVTLPSSESYTFPFDPDGDEIVVAIRFADGEEIVIHRESFEPE